MSLSNLTPITAGELMSSDIVSVKPDTTADELARLLLEKQVGGVPVIDETGALIGMVSGFDVISKPGATMVDIMSRGVVFVDVADDVEEVVSLMGLHGIRRVPVCKDGRMVGIISRSDLLRHYVRHR
jgi:CBS domain-containing protein